MPSLEKDSTRPFVEEAAVDGTVDTSPFDQPAPRDPLAVEPAVRAGVHGLRVLCGLFAVLTALTIGIILIEWWRQQWQGIPSAWPAPLIVAVAWMGLGVQYARRFSRLRHFANRGLTTAGMVARLDQEYIGDGKAATVYVVDFSTGNGPAHLRAREPLRWQRQLKKEEPATVLFSEEEPDHAALVVPTWGLVPAERIPGPSPTR